MGDVIQFHPRERSEEDPLEVLLASARARADRLESYGATVPTEEDPLDVILRHAEEREQRWAGGSVVEMPVDPLTASVLACEAFLRGVRQRRLELRRRLEARQEQPQREIDALRAPAPTENVVPITTDPLLQALAEGRATSEWFRARRVRANRNSGSGLGRDHRAQPT